MTDLGLVATLRPVDAIGALVRFARSITATGSSHDVMALLAETAVEHLGVEAAAVLAINDDEAIELVAARGLPPHLLGWRHGADHVGHDLERELVAAIGAPLANVRIVPLMSSVGLHGVLALLSAAPIELDASRTTLAEGLTDLAALASGRAADVEQLRASRDAMARTEKLRALGQMAAGVSHDLKNILNPLGLQVELLRRRIGRGDTDGAQKALDQLSEMIRLGVDTVERLRDFSRQAPESAVEAVELVPIIETAIEISRARVGQSSGLSLEVAIGAAPRVLVRPSELVTAIVNLVINASDAMRGGGTITVSSGEDGGGAWIEVADDGPGMDAETERRVFEPFFTTKGERGTGLGLSMVYALVQRHGGRVSLETAPGQGARFRLWFPAAR